MMLRKRYFLFAFVLILLLNTSVNTLAGNQNEYEQNEQGKTFGNDIQASIFGYEADYILAIGENDVCGYIKSSDLNDNILSPQEALYKQKSSFNKTTVRYIPMYEKDGTTIIGKFAIDMNDSIIFVKDSINNYLCGSTGYIYVNNHYNCLTISGIRSAFGGVRGITQITANKIVDIGWLGVQARVYKASNGALVRSTNFYYNDERAIGFEQTGFHGTVLNDGYYSKGIVKTWNPTILGYWTTDTFKSPTIY